MLCLSMNRFYNYFEIKSYLLNIVISEKFITRLEQKQSNMFENFS